MRLTNSSNDKYEILLQKVAMDMVTIIIKEVEYVAREDIELAYRKSNLYQYVINGLRKEIDRINGSEKIEVQDE